MRILIEDDERYLETRVNHNDVTTVEAVSMFAGLLLAFGYQKMSVLYAMEEYLEMEQDDYDRQD